jgi:acyl carrier protein
VTDAAVADALSTVITQVKRAEMPLSLQPETNLLHEVGFDSLEITELIFTIEDKLRITFNYERFREEHLMSFRALCHFVAQECAPANDL